MNWRLLASCRDADPALFFAADGEEPDARQTREAHAKAVCGGCPVAVPCLQFAATHGIWWGIWGGEDRESDRRRMCGKGLHLMTDENTWRDQYGHRNCRGCRNDANIRSRSRQRQEAERAA